MFGMDEGMGREEPQISADVRRYFLKQRFA